jgi:hypothetical protein
VFAFTIEGGKIAEIDITHRRARRVLRARIDLALL